VAIACPIPSCLQHDGEDQSPHNTHFWTLTESKRLKETVNPGQAHMDGFPAQSLHIW